MTEKNVPKSSPVVDVPSEDDYEEIIEWTPEEEEEFLRILRDSENGINDL